MWLIELLAVFIVARVVINLMFTGEKQMETVIRQISRVETTAAGNTIRVIETQRVTFSMWRIAFGILLGNLLTGIVAGIVYAMNNQR